jgi:hypothetical protein
MMRVTDHGAKGDRSQNDAPAIQAAIDACHQSGGGIVVVPAGNYICGTIRMRDGVTLDLRPGATLWTSPDPADYESDERAPGTHGYLLVADGVRNIGLIGLGTIRGHGDTPLGRYFGVPEFPPFRIGMVLWKDCDHVTIRDVTFLYCDSWTLHVQRCNRVVIDGITILNDIRHINSDGIDPNSCRDVHISNCHIVAGDDCIVLKSTQALPCENVVVTNCTLETTCTAIKLGTESHGDFRDIHFSNCTIRKTSVGIGFYLKDGATMERISFSGISIESYPLDYKRHSVLPIWVDIERRDPDSKLGRIRDVSFSDIQISSQASAVIQGMPERKIENLSMRNITMRVADTVSYAERSKAIGSSRRTTSDVRDTLYVQKPSYFTIANVDGLRLEGLRAFVGDEAQAVEQRSGLGLYSCSDVHLCDISRRQTPAEDQIPEVVLDDCQGALISGCVSQPGGAYLGVSGSGSRGICLVGNDLDASTEAVVVADDVPVGAVG